MIDYFDEIDTAVHTYVASELSGKFTVPTKQMAKADDTITTAGFPFFFMTYPGNMPVTTDGSGALGEQTIEVTVEVLIDAWSRFTGSEKNSWDAFKAYRSDLFNIFNVKKKGRTLNRAARVRRAVLTFTERPRYIPLNVSAKDNVAAFIAQVASLYVSIVINKE